jgi:NitT/TauT family transport system substrate-binding protein
MTRFAGRTIAAAAMAVGVLMSVVACGGSGKVTAESSGLLPLKVGYTAAGAGYSDLYDAVDQGIFRKHGLDVSIVRLNTSAQLVAGLASNSVQIGVGVAADSATAIMKGAKLKFVAMSEPVYNLEMWASPQVKTIADLKGKKVALTSPNSEGDFGLTALLQQNGMSRSDVQSDYVQSAAAEVAALDSGAVQAILTQPPQGTSTSEKGAHRLAALTNLPFPLGAYTVQSDYLSKNRDLVKKFVAAEAEALQYLPSHPTETEAAIKKYTGENDASLDEYAYKFFLQVWAKTPAVDPNLIQQGFAEAAAKAGKPAPADVSQYIDSTLYSPSS